MARRSHKKSRHGCLQCKQRHIKCDEFHPACVHCTTAGLRCSYINDISNSPASSVDPNTVTPPPGQAVPRMDSNTLVDSPQYQQSESSHSSLNMTHLELLHHFTSETYKTFVANEDEMNVGYIIIKYALSAPFLMYEVLAIAALHLSICRPERRSFFRQQSAELLGQALADFQKIDKQMNAKTISPAFLFSGLVGFQFFFDTFFSSHTDLDCFLDQLVHSINLLRGVRAVLGNWWSVLQDSELKPLLDIDDPPGYVGDSTSERFEKLRGLVREANLSPCLVKACEGAIDQLIWVHKLELVGNSMFTFRNPRRVIAWPITVSAEYTELLAQREPVALIILAHYAILLDNYREYWAIGTAGQLLLSSIEVYLGQPWEDWLVWLKASVSSVH